MTSIVLAGPLAYIIFQSCQQPCKDGNHLPDLQMRELGLREGKYLARGHTVDRSQAGGKCTEGLALHPRLSLLASLPPLQVGFHLKVGEGWGCGGKFSM